MTVLDLNLSSSDQIRHIEILDMEVQGYEIKANIVYQDNQAAMLLEQNGKESSGKRTRHYDIKYFYVTDLNKRGEIEIKYCHTDAMIADYMTKPLVAKKFAQFRNQIMPTDASRSVLD